MKVSDKFKGAFIKAANLAKPRRFTIQSIDDEEVGGEQKTVVRFDQTDQGLVLNKTNAQILADSYGDEMDDWVGQAIILKADKTLYQGSMVPCVRVAVPTGKKPVPAPAPEEEQEEFVP